MALYHGFFLPGEGLGTGRVPEARNKAKEAHNPLPWVTQPRGCCGTVPLHPHPSQGLAFGKLPSCFRPLYFTVWREKMRELVMQ